MRYHLGVDVGGTKTAALLADGDGTAVGLGAEGPGNWEMVGYPVMAETVLRAVRGALAMAGAVMADIDTAGMGMAGLDWPSQLQPHREALRLLGLRREPVLVNDAALGIPAGSAEGWGVSIESGTSCNCRGWTRGRTREGRALGCGGLWSGEAAGGVEIVRRAMSAVAFDWMRRGPATALSQAFVRESGAESLADFMERAGSGRFDPDARWARLVFDAARGGDPVALGILSWAGTELGEMACGVIRQIGIEREAFDVVCIGSIFSGHPAIERTLRETVLEAAPGARVTRCEEPPVVGAVLLGMQEAGLETGPARERLRRSVRELTRA
jgi:N-acetylglucosamine kinase-like BadF-type ATPase